MSSNAPHALAESGKRVWKVGATRCAWTEDRVGALRAITLCAPHFPRLRSTPLTDFMA